MDTLQKTAPVKVCSQRTTPSPLTGGTFLICDGHCDWQNGLHTILPIKRYGDGVGVVWCEWAFS